MLGPTSPNLPTRNGSPIPGVTEGTRYTPAAFASAAAVMEGAKVRKNHPDRKTPYADRTVDDGLGILRNVRPDSQGRGVRADFHYNRRHPFNAQVVEDVKRRMGQWGFSPNAGGMGSVEGGFYVVEQLASIRSVDLVSDPATTVTLWESKDQPTMTTFAGLLETVVLPKFKGKRRVALVEFMESDAMCEPTKKKVGDVMEDGPTMGELPVEAPAGEDPDEALKAGFRAAVNAVLDDDSMDLKGKLAKLKELLTAEEKLLSDSAAPAEPAEEEAPAETPESLSPETQARLAEANKLLAEKAAQKTCDSLGYKPTQRQLSAMVNLTESERKEFVLELVGMARSPKSFPPKPGNSAKPDEKKTESADEFLAAITAKSR